jgi:segregation and condensation protein B
MPLNDWNFYGASDNLISMDERKTRKSMLEVLLFLSGEPVSASDLKSVTGLPEAEIAELLDELSEEYRERGGGVLVGSLAGGYQMYTDPRYSEWARKFRGTARAQKLSMASLETLAIVAYKQPITKVEIEELRGVNSDGVMKSLLEKRLVKIVGKKEAPGRPMLYGTTREFLQYFGLGDLTELPTLKDLEREEAA